MTRPRPVTTRPSPVTRGARRWLAGLAGVLAITAASAGAAASSGSGVEAALGGVTQVSSGTSSSCAVLTSGQVRCWGNNFSGELGDGNLGVDAAAPVAVRNTDDTAALGGVTQVAVGGAHACARLASGQVRCWGDNFNGQLGDGSTDDSDLPVTVRNAAGTGPLVGVVAVTAGSRHSCAVLASGQARCWGDNLAGQVGNGDQPVDALTAQPVRNPTDTAALVDVAEIGAGDQFTCARLTSGRLRCWGGTASGQLGNGTTGPLRDLPVPVLGVTSGTLGGTLGLGVGGAHACAVLADRRLVCWGANAQGQLGDGTTSSSLRPALVASVTGDGDLAAVSSVSADLRSTCARLTNGQVRCWGDGDPGQLGTGVPGDRALPVVMRNPLGTGALGRVAQVAAGAGHTCVRLASATVRCVGADDDGQLGDGAPLLDQPLPVVVSGS